VKGVLFTVRKALPLLPDGASIILNASIVASRAVAPEWSVYSATKAAVRSFARTWTTDLKDRRIRVNAVSPGYTDTPPWHSREAADEHIKTISNGIPLGRFAPPDEFAKSVVFLASDDSSYVTGTELFVDGGFAQVYAGSNPLLSSVPLGVFPLRQSRPTLELECLEEKARSGTRSIVRLHRVAWNFAVF